MGERQNSIMFGTHSSEVLRNYCLGLEFKIPDDVGVIEERGHKRRFNLYGKTEDFKTVSRYPANDKVHYLNLRESNSYLVFCMEMIRGFITRDGRIFYDEEELKRKRVHFLNESLAEGKEIFKAKERALEGRL